MRTLIGLVATLALTAAMTGPAAADTAILKKADKRGDVKIYKNKAISKAKKKSIDIDRASIVQLDNGKFRYKVRIKKIHRSKKWDQMVFFSSTRKGGDPTKYTEISFKIRNSGGAYGYESQIAALCQLTVKRKGRTTWVDVPRKCAAQDGDTVRVSTVTGHYQTDAPAYSSDSLRLGIFRHKD